MNKVLLIGRLGSDPEVRQTPGGAKVLAVSLATSMRYKDKTSGERKEKTEWHRLVVWNRLAEVVGEFCRKGSQIFVEGRMETRKWVDQAGVERYTTEVVVENLELLGSAGGGGAKAGGVPVPESPPEFGADKSNFDFDDDIPF